MFHSNGLIGFRSGNFQKSRSFVYIVRIPFAARIETIWASGMMLPRKLSSVCRCRNKSQDSMVLLNISTFDRRINWAAFSSASAGVNGLAKIPECVTIRKKP